MSAREENIVVLGSGLSALSYLLYHPNSVAVFGRKSTAGGLAAMADKLGPQLLWVDADSTRLLRDLSVSVPVRDVRVGHLVHSSVHVDRVYSADELDPADLEVMRVQYSLKTRGTPPASSHMSGGHSAFQVFDVSFRELSEVLNKRVSATIVHENAVSVHTQDHVVTTDSGLQVKFDRLVSTIPAPAFARAAGRPHLVDTLRARAKSYRTVTYDSLGGWAIEALDAGFEYAYAPGAEYDFHRARFMENVVILEYTHPEGSEANLDRLASDQNAVIHRGGQIVSGGEAFRDSFLGVKFLGRYASWDHGVKMNQVLRKIYGGLS